MRNLYESILDSDKEIEDKVNKASLPIAIVQTLEEIFKYTIKSKIFDYTWIFGDLDRLRHLSGDKLITAVDDDVKRFCISLNKKFKGLKINIRYIKPRDLSIDTDETRWSIIISYKSVKYILIIGLYRDRGDYSIADLDLTATDDDIIALLPK